MAVLTGMAGSVSWSTGIHAQLAGTGCAPVNWRVNVKGSEHETTPFSLTDPMTSHIKGLYSWDGEFETTLVSPEIGALGLVTFTAGYTTNLNEWTMEIIRAAHESTAFGATERAFIPGLVRWGGTFAGFLDGTTLTTLPGNSSEPATGTFKYSERGGTDATLAGSIFTTAQDIDVSPRDIAKVAYTYRGSGALTQSTPTTGEGIIPTGALGAQAATTLTLAVDGSRSVSGSAFWTRISIACAAAELTTVRVGFQGTGALTIT